MALAAVNDQQEARSLVPRSSAIEELGADPLRCKIWGDDGSKRRTWRVGNDKDERISRTIPEISIFGHLLRDALASE